MIQASEIALLHSGLSVSAAAADGQSSMHFCCLQVSESDLQAIVDNGWAYNQGCKLATTQARYLIMLR